MLQSRYNLFKQVPTSQCACKEQIEKLTQTVYTLQNFIVLKLDELCTVVKSQKIPAISSSSIASASPQQSDIEVREDQLTMFMSVRV